MNAPASVPPLHPLAERLAVLRRAIAEAAPGRTPTLIGASKTQPAPVLVEAIGLGLMDFGENKVQEAQAKWPALKAAHPQVRLHLIGPLQSNKADDAVALFDVIQTVDREKIAQAILQAARKRSAMHPGWAMPECYVQVNTGEESQKGGVRPSGLGALLDYCENIGLPITGLMCIPPAAANPAPHFALLAKLAAEHGLTELSMGMSEDYATAIRLGATQVRVGTRLFGARAASA